MRAPNPPCKRDCPGREPGCHNVKTCEPWKKYQEALMEYHEALRRERRAEKDWRETRGSILAEENRIGRRKHC